MQITKRLTVKRLSAILLLITFLFALLAARLISIQLVNNERYVKLAKEQWLRDIPIVAKRGLIYDVNGVVLADTKTEYTLYVRPNAVTDFVAITRDLSNILEIDYDYLYSKITKKGVSEIRIKRGITKEIKDKIVLLNHKGVLFSQDIKRVYPYGNYLTQILGFTNIDSIGQSGLELYYNDYLKGINGMAAKPSDLVGRELTESLEYYPSVNGMNLYTSIDYHIEAMLENLINRAKSDYNALSSSAIVYNATKGEIVAMANTPNYDLNDLPRNDLSLLLQGSKCSLLSDVYEPGSTFKILTAAIALNENLVSENERFYCPGYKMVDGQRIKCWKSGGHGSISFKEGVEKSCNCVFMCLAERIGKERLYDYFDRLTLTSKKGIDMAGEGYGIRLKQDLVKSVDLARIGFGQAIAVTPLSLVCAVGEIITGNKNTPSIVRSIKTDDNQTAYNRSEKNTQSIFKTDTAEHIREYLYSVVDNGSGKNAAVKGYHIGGKTGTAQKYENGRIAEGKYISSFIGFSNVNGDEYVILFIVNEPKGYVYYGSLVAAPYVSELFARIFEYKNVKSYLEVSINEVPMPDLIGMNYQEMEKLMKETGLKFEESGDSGVVTRQFPQPNTKLEKGSVCWVNLE